MCPTGVCSNSANLTFAPADFLDNNNLPAVACPSGKISGHHGDPGRWRPSDKTAGSAGDDPSDAGAKQLGECGALPESGWPSTDSRAVQSARRVRPSK